MISNAKSVYPETSFYCAQKVFVPADYTVISGTLNLKMNASEEVWWMYIQKQLKECWSFSRMGMRFNLLERAHKANKAQSLYYCDPEVVLQFCLKHFSAASSYVRKEQLGDVHFYVPRSHWVEMT